MAFRAVTVQQAWARLPTQHHGQFPTDVLCIGQTVVQSSNAKDRNDMGAVADEEDAPIAVIVQRQRVR